MVGEVGGDSRGGVEQEGRWGSRTREGEILQHEGGKFKKKSKKFEKNSNYCRQKKGRCEQKECTGRGGDSLGSVPLWGRGGSRPGGGKTCGRKGGEVVIFLKNN